MAFMRKSKFRHVFGKGFKREQCYDNMRITKSSWDSKYCDVNPKFVAIVVEAAGGGAFLVLPISKVGRVEMDTPMVAGHKAAVLDLQFCPHNDNIIASASEDCTIKIWEIPDEGLKTNLTTPKHDLFLHQKRVTAILWHPIAEDVLLSAGSDDKIIVWSIAEEEPQVYQEIDLPSSPMSMSLNMNGSRLACTLKEKGVRIVIVDPRKGEILHQGKGHGGNKPQRIVYLKNGNVFTTGFSRMSERQYALWDVKNLDTPINIQDIDQSNGVLFPFYDPDTSMVYLMGKGDSLVRYYEITDEEPYVHFLNLYQGNDSMRGFALMGKRGVNVNQCEVTRLYKLTSKGQCEVIAFYVPRKSELYQEDLYPDTAGMEPALTGEQWFFEGKDADPILICMKDGYVSSTGVQSSAVRKANIAERKKTATPAKKTASAVKHASTPAPTTVAAADLPPEKPAPVKEAPPAAPAAEPVAAASAGFDPSGILEDIRKLKLIVKAHERRIKSLEDKVSQYEANTSEEETGNNADAC